MFGKLAPKFNPKTLKVEKYLKADSPPIPEPAKTYWEYLVKSYPMMKNDQIGDCTCACIGHLIQLWTAHTGTMYTPTDDEVVAVYSAVTGYNGDPSTDNGAAITDILNYIQTTGMAGHKIDGWASVAPTNHSHVEQSVYLFGGLDIGFNVPQSAMDQNQAGQTWDLVPDDGGIVGGHSVPVVGYGSKGCTCITWGALQKMTWAFFDNYCDESYAPLSLDWLNSYEVAPNHLDLATLRADLQAVKA